MLLIDFEQLRKCHSRPVSKKGSEQKKNAILGPIVNVSYLRLQIAFTAESDQDLKDEGMRKDIPTARKSLRKLFLDWAKQF